MRVTKLLIFICIFGLLSGAKIVNESLVVLRATEFAQQYDKNATTPLHDKAGSIGETFLVTALALSTVIESRTIDGVAAEATSKMLVGCSLIVVAVLTLCLLAILHVKAKKTSALRGARRRRREMP